MGLYTGVLFGLFLLGFFTRPNTNSFRKRWYLFLSFGCMAVISALRKYTVGRDLTAHYFKMFSQIIRLNWDQLNTTDYEAGYVAFYKLIGLFTTNPQWMIAVHAVLVVGISGWFIYRNSDDVVFSTFLFIADNTWFMYMNILRQSLSVCMFLVALEVWKRKNWHIRRYVLFVAASLLSMQFHSSGIISFVVPLLDCLHFRRREFFASLVALAASFFLYDRIFMFISALISVKRNYAAFYVTSGAAINLISIYGVASSLMFFFLAGFVLVFRRKRRKKRRTPRRKQAVHLSDSMLLHLCVMLLICKVTGLRINIMGRMSYYFSPCIWILVPRTLAQMRLPSNRYITETGILVLMIVAFLWIGTDSGYLLYGTVPYTPFWG